MKFVESTDSKDKEKLKKFYKKLLDQVPDVIFKMIYRTDDTNVVTFISERVNDIYELTVEEILKDADILFRERILPEDKEVITAALVKSNTTGVAWDPEFRVMLPKKGLRWLKLSAMPEPQADGSVHYFGRVTDITEMKEQELKLKKDQERMEFALDAASEGIWDWNIVTNMVHFTPETMKILGLEPKEITVPQSFWLDRIHPDDVIIREAAKKKGLKKNNISYESIYRVRTESGKYKWLLSRGRAVEFDENGKATRAIGIHKDITEMKEKEIELANTINIISSQNNRLSNFAHIVSHNLRSHAGNLKMLLDLLKSADEKEREEMLQHLEAISDGLSITISHLKELVEIQFEVKIVKEKLNLRSYLKNILNILHNEITKHGVTIEINIPLDVTVDYNPAYLESILLNFTTNAIKYSSTERKPMISYDFSITDGKKVLAVSDNGLGIDLKKHKNSLFGMYKTFHKHQNSRGIGLFITKNQVEAMGGRIEVTSEVNNGTTFKIYFNEED
jgi:PAS domain S-box-containing protein